VSAPAGVGAVATAWLDRWWDPTSGLLHNPAGSYEEPAEPGTLPLVPQSAWYAIGLLRRDGPGDRERAELTLGAVADQQYDAPGQVWDGTFARFGGWPEPGPGAREWEDYDPNWRQFVGTAFSLVLGDLGDRISAATAARLRTAIDRAVAGEPPGRVPAWYANIALMKAWLDVEAGRVDEGEAFAAEVVARFGATGAFLEYGSPTYYGIDLYALGLWRTRSRSARLRAWGAEVEAALWRDVARWYHPGLRNLCGPYARAYGMDMTAYAGALGLWLWDELGPAAAPFPAFGDRIAHGHDVALAPCVELIGPAVPADVAPRLARFDGDRTVEQVVDADLGLRATGWLSELVMAGGASGAAFDATGQYHPATVHWRTPDGGVGWLRLRHRGPLDAVAAEGSLTVTTRDHPAHGPTSTRVLASHPGTLTTGRWRFPGLDVAVEGGPHVDDDGRLATAGTTTFTLHLRPTTS